MCNWLYGFLFVANLKYVQATILEKKVNLSPWRWIGHFSPLQSGALDYRIPSNPHGNNLGLSSRNVYPPHLWNGFPQDINKHMATDSTDRSSCHLWCHFCPYVKAGSQRIGLCQYGPWWFSCLSWPKAMDSGTAPVTMAYHYIHVWDLRELSAKRAHTVGSGYLNHKA